MRLRIRCCCQGTKILGTMEVPAAAILTGVYAMSLPERASFVSTPEQMAIGTSVFIRTFRDKDGADEFAVYSDDHPKEYWERFPSFRPVQEQPWHLLGGMTPCVLNIHRKGIT